MGTAGELKKMLILAFADSEACESGGESDADARYEALINPETYTQEFKLKFSDGAQGHGTSGQQLKYEYTAPEEMSFEFSSTTPASSTASRATTSSTRSATSSRCWSTTRATRTSRGISSWSGATTRSSRAASPSWASTYKLFRPDGTPTRAVARVKFKASIEDVKRAAKEDRSSPDLTHVRIVKGGDTLPLMCHRIYGDPAYHLAVAEVNRLDNPRRLVPGLRLSFPPLEERKA